MAVNTPRGVTVHTVSFARPADTTAYTANDLVAGSTSVAATNSPIIADAVYDGADGFRLDRVRLYKSGTSLTNASFRVHIFNALPVWSVGDNGAGGAINALAVSDMASHVGFVDITMDRASATAGAYGMANPSSGAITVKPSVITSTAIYVAVQALAAYTPASAETFTVALEGIRP
jgi:hypothetical protein